MAVRGGSPHPASLLKAAVRCGLNMLIAGGMGSGKTTWLNALGASVSGLEERVVTIEETAELQLEPVLPDCEVLQGREPNAEGAGGVSIRSLVKNALRMRPTRIAVGEVRGAEALDMLLATCPGQQPRTPPGATNDSRTSQDGRFALLRTLTTGHRWIRG